MITAIIIDDEQHCINNLKHLLKENCSATVVLKGAFKTVDEGVAAIIQLQPELVFLDVEIGDKTAFYLLEKLQQINFEIIFTTAHNKYAVQAFRLSAFDFLLKPICKDDLIKSVYKLNDKLSKADMARQLEVLFHNYKTVKGTAMKIGVPVTTGLEFLNVSEIIRCESSKNYTMIFTNDRQKLVVAKTLKDYEELLTGFGFFRIHYSHLINLNYVKSYKKGKGGLVVMEDGSELEVSTRRKEEFLREIASL